MHTCARSHTCSRWNTRQGERDPAHGVRINMHRQIRGKHSCVICHMQAYVRCIAIFATCAYCCTPFKIGQIERMRAWCDRVVSQENGSSISTSPRRSLGDEAGSEASHDSPMRGQRPQTGLPPHMTEAQARAVQNRRQSVSHLSQRPMLTEHHQFASQLSEARPRRQSTQSLPHSPLHPMLTEHH
jgi:hypothetical protein